MGSGNGCVIAVVTTDITAIRRLEKVTMTPSATAAVELSLSPLWVDTSLIVIGFSFYAFTRP